ncbi:MAG: disulfide bond formation protein B [Actinomycetales bacterium]|nr:disulfide bond formation protein B [Actinomycetales bacterium]
MLTTLLDGINGRSVVISRAINIAALLGLLVVLSGSLFLQFGVGEPPCPLCLIQRSGMIGLAVGPIMNLLWGLRPAHYALSILGAIAGGAGSVRQILLHIADPGDPGYGPAVLGFHLYTWAFITFLVGTIGCALLLLWTTPFEAGDGGVLHQRGIQRWIALSAIIWVGIDALLIGLAVLPECGLGMCPDNPESSFSLGDMGGITFILGTGVTSFLLGFLASRRLGDSEQPDLR